MQTNDSQVFIQVSENMVTIKTCIQMPVEALLTIIPKLKEPSYPSGNVCLSYIF